MRTETGDLTSTPGMRYSYPAPKLTCSYIYYYYIRQHYTVLLVCGSDTSTVLVLHSLFAPEDKSAAKLL